MAHDHAHDHSQDHSHMTQAEALQCCTHHEISIERWIVFTLVGGVLVLVTTICRHLQPGV